jgi:16S rRNA (cytidine1402-2'-O)-methyltransferase
VKDPERTAALKQLEQESKRKHQTQLWIETPYRNAAMIEAMLQSLQGNTRMCVAADLSLPNALVISKTVSAWQAHIKKEPGLLQALHQRPAVFLILA